VAEPTPIEIISPATYFDEYSKHLGEREKCTEPELPTGIPKIDQRTNGFKRGGLWIVGARPNIGKTSFATATAQNLLERDKRVLFFTTEMPRDDIFNRFISLKTGIPYFDIEKRNLDKESRKIIEDYGRQFKSKNLFICDERQPTIRAIDEALSRLRPDFFIFDHIQRITHSADQRYLEIANFVKQLNDLSLKYNCSILINSQLNRVAEFERPALHHLKECGALEEEAHVAILLSSLTTFDDQAEKIVLCDIAKHRNGPTGEVKLRFKRNISKFEEVE
jgi:replicative DNA helicase